MWKFVGALAAALLACAEAGCVPIELFSRLSRNSEDVFRSCKIIGQHNGEDTIELDFTKIGPKRLSIYKVNNANEHCTVWAMLSAVRFEAVRVAGRHIITNYRRRLLPLEAAAAQTAGRRLTFTTLVASRYKPGTITP
jgi:hypothetical protein